MKASIIAHALACALILAAAPVAARLTEISVATVEPFADGAPFGDTGSYERMKGTFKGELDPVDPRNRIIVNIERAPRNAAGKVEYEADFFMLRPRDATRGNRKILYDVTNRGRMYVHWRLMDALLASPATMNDPRTVQDAGNGLLLRRGYTIVWSGWDPDAPRSNNGLAIKPVIATNGGVPIVRVIRDELTSGTRGAQRETFRLTHEAATLDQARAKLTVRRTEADVRREIPGTGWTYVNAREIRLAPEGTKPEPGSLYEFHYAATNPRVLGIGLAATRDLVSFLRYEKADARGNVNPAGTGIRHALGFGMSQAGRYLRDHVALGFNQDESARKVFDGVLAHTAGVGGVFLNAEFGQPARTATQHEDHTFPELAFPFSTARVTDPVTGRTGSLLRGDGFDPLWMETNTSTEYWQKGASLLVTDPLGNRDVELPPNVRSYFIAGTQHGGRAWMTSTAGPCVNSRVPHSPTPALRALLVALDEWVSESKAPPHSRTPRIWDGTFTAPRDLGFPPIPGVRVARRVNEIGVLRDWVKPELDMSKPYRALVPQVDLDGNETSGILLPDVAVPLATHTGWNLYKAPFPEGELCDRDGTYVLFPATRAERQARNDPRASLEERYGTHAAYVQRLTEAANRLVAERLLLREDAEALVAKARSAETVTRFAPDAVAGAAGNR
jgi:alpha/beta hydrolase family protein